VLFLIVLLIVTISTVLWLQFLRRLDIYHHDKQTTKMVSLGFVLGMLSVIPTMILYILHPMQENGEVILYMFLVVGPVEEVAKFLMFILMVFCFRSIREPQDGIIQGASIGLGFAAIENIEYGMRYGVNVTVVRSLLSSGGHMTYGALWGFLFATAVYENLEVKNSRSVQISLFSFFPVAMLHSLYNSVLHIGDAADGLGWGIIVKIFGLILSVKAFLVTVEHSPYRVFPYNKAGDAIRQIRRGLLLNPKSFVLNRRLMLYYLAAELYSDAAAAARFCASRTKKKAPYLVVEGVVLMGAHKHKDGQILVDQGLESLPRKDKYNIELVLRRVVRNAGLQLSVNRILHPIRQEKNPFHDRFTKYGKKDYWKSDARLLRERSARLGEVIRETDNPISGQ
jgi:protease PrsW